MAGGYSEDFFGETGAAAAHAPFLILTGGADDVGMADDWPRLGGVDRTWIDLAGGCHQTFALGVCDTLDPELGYDVVNAYALAFGRAHVLGDDGADVTAALDGSALVSDIVTFQRESAR